MRLIDADALIEAMEERKKIWLSKCEYNDAIREVKEAPTVERPHGEWIPCSERLPDKRGFYLITFKTGGEGRSVVMKFYRTEENLWTDDGVNRGFFLLPDEVTAWMPLPEPKEAEEGEGE